MAVWYASTLPGKEMLRVISPLCGWTICTVTGGAELADSVAARLQPDISANTRTIKVVVFMIRGVCFRDRLDQGMPSVSRRAAARWRTPPAIRATSPLSPRQGHRPQRGQAEQPVGHLRPN